MLRILCVCLGNICRSPMAEAVLRAKASQAGLTWDIDSAATGSWHLGKPPDTRAYEAARKRGYDTSDQLARQVQHKDFTAFDLILAMDARNLSELEDMRPPNATAKIRLFDPDGREVPDPYFGGRDDFEIALDMLESAADLIISQLALRHATGPLE